MCESLARRYAWQSNMEDNKLDIVVDGIIYESQARGGISRVFNEVLPRLCDIDETSHITLLTQGQLKQALPQHRCITHYSIPNVERYLRPKRIWKPLMPAANELIRKVLVGRGAGKIWHSTYYTTPEKWTGYSVATVHDMVFELFPQFYSGPNFDLFRQRKHLSVQRADAVICVSGTTRQDVLRLYELDADKLHVVPNACSDVFRQLEQSVDIPMLSTNRPFLLYVGSRARYKNFDLLIHAYSKWPQHEEIDLLFVGGKPWSQTEQRTLTELGVQNQVKLLGDIDDKTLCYLYNRAVGFVHPSLYEGFGITLLEAMACGCPIIASRIPSTIEVAKDCPIYFDPNEEDELLNALDIALSQGRNSERVRAGLEIVESYSWDKAAAQTLEVYRAIGIN